MRHVVGLLIAGVLLAGCGSAESAAPAVPDVAVSGSVKVMTPSSVPDTPQEPLGYEVPAASSDMTETEAQLQQFAGGTRFECLSTADIVANRVSAGGIPEPNVSATPVLQPPVADAGGPYVLPYCGSFAVDGDKSRDEKSRIVGYMWDLDSDGDWDCPLSEFEECPVGGQLPEGRYTATLRVVNALGEASDDTTVLYVAAPGSHRLTGPDAQVWLNVDAQDDPFTKLVVSGNVSLVRGDDPGSGYREPNGVAQAPKGELSIPADLLLVIAGYPEGTIAKVKPRDGVSFSEETVTGGVVPLRFCKPGTYGVKLHNEERDKTVRLTVTVTGADICDGLEHPPLSADTGDGGAG